VGDVKAEISRFGLPQYRYAGDAVGAQRCRYILFTSFIFYILYIIFIYLFGPRHIDRLGPLNVQYRKVLYIPTHVM
jgi:hypothetical protein